VADALALDRVLWIPAARPPHKSDARVSPASLRLEMVRAAAAEDPRFEVSTLELERPGPSYMVDTVRALGRELPGATLVLIVGVDQLRSFGTWREPDEIVRLARLVVMNRGADSATAPPNAPLPWGAESVAVRAFEISSTEVRGRVARGLEIRGLVPDSVREVIERERLYSPA